MQKTNYMTIEEIAKAFVFRTQDIKTGKQLPNFLTRLTKISPTIDNNKMIKTMQDWATTYDNHKLSTVATQYEKAVKNTTWESNAFIENIKLFSDAFYSGTGYEDTEENGTKPTYNYNNQVKALHKLANKINDKKLQYEVIKSLPTSSEDVLGREKREILSNNPYATAADILGRCHDLNINDIYSPLFQRGLKQFDKEFADEIKKDKPDFRRLANVSSLYIGNLCDGHADMALKYSPTFFDERIRVAMLEAENKKLKTEMKTTKLKTGISNVAKKSNTTKSTISKTK